MKKITKAIVKKAMVAVFAIMGVMAACAEVTTNAIYDAGVSVGYQVSGLGDLGNETAIVFTNHNQEINWPVPHNLENVEFLVVGGGGGGGATAYYGSTSPTLAGAGGGGGGVITGYVNFDGNSTVLINVGQGGDGGKHSAYKKDTNDENTSGSGASSPGSPSVVKVGDVEYVRAMGGGNCQGLLNHGGEGASNGGCRKCEGSSCTCLNTVGMTEEEKESKKDRFFYYDERYVFNVSRFGNMGGCTYEATRPAAAGGGGGAVGPGGRAETLSNTKTGFTNGGAGGPGLESMITGVRLVFGSGGGGGTSRKVGTKNQPKGGEGGKGGEGAGDGAQRDDNDNVKHGGDAVANQGGGGGGAAYKGNGGNGGSGIVVFRYVQNPVKPVAAINLTYTGEELVGIPEGAGYYFENNSNKATEVGTYTAVAKLQEGKTWSDGTTDDCTIEWTISTRLPEKSLIAAEDGYIVRGLGNSQKEIAFVFTKTSDEINWVPPATLENVQFLVVGGGGGGGADNSSDSNERIAGAGGGGGGVVTGLVNFDKEAVVSITVGAGGSGGRLAVDASDDSGYGGAYNGEASIFGVDGTAWVTAFGGGSDQGADTDNAYVGGKNGSAGGSGAGGRGNANGGAETQGDVNSVNVTSFHKYGFPGGNGCTVANGGYGYGAAGGGGGATAAGYDGTKEDAYKGGDGGAGLASDITGIVTVYGSGGGGSSTWGSAGAGGEGAGDGGYASNGENALANQGGGGGGSSRKAATGGNGGSGIVVFRFVYPEVASVDGYGYLDLDEAISAADAGDTVTLLANAGNIELGKSIALNLNGCTVDQITLTGTDVTLTAPEGLNVKTSVDGYEVAYDDGVYSLQKVAVVQIGETTYATLAEAVAAAQSGDTIVLIENVELAETVTIPEGKTLTIDLNGKSISMEESIVTTAYALNNLGTLTLKDSVGTGSVNARGIYNGYGNGADNVATAKIIIQSGTYNAKGTNGGAAIFNYGIAEINGGSFTSIGGYSLNNQAGSSMTIADGVTANNGIYCSNAKVTVNGGNISGNRSGCHVVYAWNAELTINGGTFYNNNSGNATIMSAGTTKCTITGGTFGIKDGRVEGDGNTWTSCLTDTANTATMTVTGGIFNGGFRVQAGTTMTIEGGSFNDVGGSGYNIYGTASVKGGTFTDTTAQNFAKANLADGFELNVGGNVVEIPAVAQIGETKYATLSEAFAAVQNGETVKLLKDVAASETITVAGKSITLDLNGKTISGVCNTSQSCLVYVENNAALTVKDSAGNGKLTYAQGTSNVGWTVDVKGAFVLESGTVELTGSWSIGYAVDVRPNAWGAAYVNPTVFTMNGGNIVSSDGGVRVASSSSDIYKNVSASFVMNGGKIDAAWDGVFIQQSDAIYDNLAFEITGGTIESDLNPVRVYGPAPTGYVSGQDCMNIALKGGTLEYTGTESYEWVVDGILRVGGGSSAETIVENGSLSVSDEIAADSAAPEGFKWESASDGMAVLVAKPTAADLPDAEVTNLGSITVGLGDYKADAYMMYDIINGGKLQEATVPYDLTLAMDFKAKDTAETAAQNAFGNYTTDFFITMSGMSQASFVGDGCYLAGYYPSFKAWVKIPLDGFTVENGKVYPVITSAGFDFKYTDICGTVGQFICGIYLTPEVLAANPNLTVDLTLGLAENKDAALNAEFLKVDNYVYNIDNLVTLPEVVITDIKSTLTDADPDLTFALNFAIKDADKLSEEYLEKLFAKYGDYYTDYVLTISGLTDPNGSVKFNANGTGDGYLAGQYDAWSKSWVTVPFSDVTVKNGQSFYIMEYAAELMGKGGLRLTLKEIAEIVKNFDCGVYFTPEFLAANPNLKVELELKVFTEDENGNKVGDISVATNTFDKDDFSVEAAKLDIRIVNGKPQIGFAGEGKLVLNAATALTGEWTKNIEYTLVENDGDDTKTWVTPAEGYYFFKGFITK